MNQRNLFDDCKIARTLDPETSKEAASVVAPKLDTARGQMFHVWKRITGTANEAAAQAVKEFGGNHETFRKRKAELYRSGLIELVKVRKCNHTGMNAEVYRAVDGKA